jgi:hypothetical protein
MRVTIERIPGNRYRKPRYVPIAHVEGIGAIRGPELASRHVAKLAARLIRQEVAS